MYFADQCFCRSDYVKAEAHYEDALREFELATDPPGRAHAHLGLGQILHGQGYVRRAMTHYRAARPLLCREKETTYLTRCLDLYAASCLQTGKTALAERCFSRALRIRQKDNIILAYGLERWVSTSTGILAAPFAMAMDIADALCLKAIGAVMASSSLPLSQAYHSALLAYDIHSTKRYARGVANIFYVWARISESQDDRMKAQRQYKHAIELANQIGDLKTLAIANQGFARTARAQRKRGKYHKAALRLFQELECNPDCLPTSPSCLNLALEMPAIIH